MPFCYFNVCYETRDVGRGTENGTRRNVDKETRGRGMGQGDKETGRQGDMGTAGK